jgi:hypothetical protein
VSIHVISTDEVEDSHRLSVSLRKDKSDRIHVSHGTVAVLYFLFFLDAKYEENL